MTMLMILVSFRDHINSLSKAEEVSHMIYIHIHLYVHVCRRINWSWMRWLIGFFHAMCFNAPLGHCGPYRDPLGPPWGPPSDRPPTGPPVTLQGPPGRPRQPQENFTWSVCKHCCVNLVLLWQLQCSWGLWVSPGVSWIIAWLPYDARWQFLFA